MILYAIMVIVTCELLLLAEIQVYPKRFGFTVSQVAIILTAMCMLWPLVWLIAVYQLCNKRA